MNLSMNFLFHKLISTITLRAMMILISLFVLVACGTNVQAPVSEQGVRLPRNVPIIVDSSTPDRLLRASQSAAAVSSSPVSAAPARAVSNGNSISRTPISSSPVQRAAIVARPTAHTVKSGDTLYSIAFEYDVDFRGLAAANNLRAPYTIFVDQQINLDLSRVTNSSLVNNSLTNNTNLGTEASNNSVARAQATTNSSSGAVSRQSISSSQSTTQSADIRWRWPYSGRVLRAFGTGENRGLDIAGNVGDAVLAAGDGDVVYSGNGVQGSGDLIIIRHSDRFLSAYAHNSIMLVSEGSSVRAGDKIAEIGETPAGESMLHFEIRVDGDTVDPIRFLPKR